MSRFVLPLFFAVIIFSGIMPSCAQTAEVARGDGHTVCGASENIAVCFFSNAELQGGDGPAGPVRDAIKDALTLPLAQLRARRYPDYQMKPDEWTFEQIIGAYFIPNSLASDGHPISIEKPGFIEAVKQPEMIPVLEKWLAEMDEAIRQYESAE
jgi:hypothetical protein